MTLKKLFKKIEGNSRKVAKKIWQKKITRKIILGIGLFVIGLAVLFFSFSLAYQNKIFPRTYIGTQNFGGLNSSDAKTKLNQLIASSGGGKLNFSFDGKDYNTNIDDLEVNYADSANQTVDELMSVGRSGGIGEIIKENLRSIFLGNYIEAKFFYNNLKLTEYLDNIAKNVDQTEKDASIEIKNNQPQVTKEETGRRFEMTDNRKILISKIGQFVLNSNLPFKVSEVKPKIDSKTAEAALEQTRELMTKKLTMTGAGKTFNLSSEDITGMIEFIARPDNGNSSKYVLSPEISSAKLSENVSSIAKEIYQEPKDPKFQVSSGRVTAFQTAQTGYELDMEKSVTQIVLAIKNNQQVLELPVKVTESNLSSSDPATLGLNELISEGRTSWRGSPSNRIHNLTLGSNNISGTIVKPGEEFSTVKAIGEISAEAGFLPELVIKNSNQVAPEIGGGLCQVSTTLFRAVLNAGLKVTARTAHSFRVSYYEPPVGMDATIYDPAPDFKFINNMDTPIFIWAIAGNNSLAFQIYGTKDNRKVEISEPNLYDSISPSAPVYSESASMAAGDIRQVERATPGISASFTYKVTANDGKVLENDTFVSKYVPIPDTFLYGPGTPDIPTPAPETP